jgi:hypothetical protein
MLLLLQEPLKLYVKWWLRANALAIACYEGCAMRRSLYSLLSAFSSVKFQMVDGNSLERRFVENSKRARERI